MKTKKRAAPIREDSCGCDADFRLDPTDDTELPVATGGVAADPKPAAARGRP